MFILLLFVSSINFNMFIKPSKIVSGGMNGLALLVKDIFNISPDVFVFYFSLFVLLISIITLGIIESSSIIGFTFCYPVFVNITANMSNFINLSNNWLFIYAILIGLVSGIVNGICFRIKLATGPIPLISEIINKYTKISLGRITLYLNTLIILLGAYNYGYTKAIYAVLSIFVNSFVVDKITLAKTSKNV